jgi:hypothetical protein
MFFLFGHVEELAVLHDLGKFGAGAVLGALT